MTGPRCQGRLADAHRLIWRHAVHGPAVRHHRDAVDEHDKIVRFREYVNAAAINAR